MPDSESERRSSALIQATWVSSSQVLAQVLFLVRGLFLARLLGQFGFGVWSAMRLVRDLGRYVSLGAPEGMEQLAPYARASGEQVRADRLRAVATWVVAMSAMVTAGSIALVAAIRGGSLRLEWVVFAGVFILAQMYLLGFAALRTLHRFRSIGIVTLIVTSCSMLGLAAIESRGLAGFLWVLGASYGLGLVLFSKVLPHVRVTLDRRLAGELIRTGLPIVGVGILTTLQWSMDKIFLWVMLGNSALGVYSLSPHLVQAVMVFPRNVAAVMYPRLRERLGKSGSLRPEQGEIEGLTRLLGGLALPSLGLLWIGLEALVVLALPEYLDAVAPGRILLLGAYLPIVASLTTPVLISVGRRRWLMGSQVLGLAATGVGLWLVRSSDPSLVEVAMASASGLTLQAALACGAMVISFDIPRQTINRYLVEMGLPFVALVGILLTVIGLHPARAVDEWTTARAAMAVALGVGLLVRLVWVLQRGYRRRGH